MNNGANAWLGVRERGEEARHEPTCGGTEYSEACFPRDFFVTGCDVGRNIVHFVHDAPGAFGNSEPFIGELATMTVDECGA